MRRQDREINEFDKILEVVYECDCCRLGFADGSVPYIVPLNFGIEVHGESVCFYFHGATEGKKVGLLKSNSRAFFEMDTGHELIFGENACSYGFRYKCIMGQGKIETITDFEEKKRGLCSIMKHYTSRSDWNFTDNQLTNTLIFKLIVDSWTCKVRE